MTPTERLELLSKFAKKITFEKNLGDAAQVVIEEVVKQMGADRGLLLVERGAREPAIEVEYPRDGTPIAEVERSHSRTVIEKVRETFKPLVTGNAQVDADLRFARSIRLSKIKSIVCAPMLVEGRFLGAIYLDSVAIEKLFTEEDATFLGLIADLAAVALSNARSRDRLYEAARVSEEFVKTLDVQSVLDGMFARVVALTQAEQGFLLLKDAEGDFTVRQSRDRFGEAVPPKKGRLSQTILQKVAQSGEAVLVADAATDLGPDLSRSALSLRSVLCVPIREGGTVLGVLYLQNSLDAGVFGPEDRRLVQLLADWAGMAISIARLHDQEKAIVEALANAIEVRDFHTGGHVERVAVHAVAVGKKLGLSDEELSDLRRSAILHDIGKIGIPDAVLLKKGPLTEEEREVIITHPDIGAKIASPICRSPAVLAGIRSHQERFDGLGYPQRLRGREIPLFGRIIAVVDAFDAMVGERPYRAPKSKEEAIEEIRRGSGTQFAPEVVQAFLQVIQHEAERPKSG